MLSKPIRMIRNEIEWWEENLDLRSVNLDISLYLNAGTHPSQNPWGIPYSNLLDIGKSQLCREYYNANELNKYCVGCPVSLITGKDRCFNTPYTKFQKQYGKLITSMNRVKNNKPTKKQLENIKDSERETYKLCCEYFELLKEVQIDINKGEK